MDVSVIIVNYNTKELIRKCINSIKMFTSGVKYEVIIVDNASGDESVKMIRSEFPWVILIENDKNIGFGSANNMGANKAKGKYLFFLNPDCILLNNAILLFFEFIEKYNADGAIGAVGGLLLNENMELNSSYQRFPKILNTVYFDYRYYLRKFIKLSANQPGKINYLKAQDAYFEVEFIVGADLFMPSKVFKELNGFDERFFLYFEETDLQKSLANKGFNRIIINGPRIIHLEGSSIDVSIKSLRATTIFKDSMFKYFRKHFSGLQYFMFYFLIAPILTLQLLRPDIPCIEKKAFLGMLRRNI
jgi:GT2 family glycosyltransferase